jgi:hypothetical protein
MSAMATLFTRADRDALPVDGHRHELLDGGFFVTPSPGFAHHSVVMRLGPSTVPGCRGHGARGLLHRVRCGAGRAHGGGALVPNSTADNDLDAVKRKVLGGSAIAGIAIAR